MSSVADIPIIFSAPMVAALLDGRKTMTRRLAWRDGSFVGDRLPKPSEHITHHNLGSTPIPLSHPPSPWQKVKPGDRLWVREAWKPHSIFEAIKPRDIPQSRIFYLSD